MEQIPIEGFEGYSKLSKYLLILLFFLLGIFNHLGTILVMTGGRVLAIELDMSPYIAIYTSVATLFSVATRLLNSKLFLKVAYKKRVIILCFWVIFGYVLMFLVLHFHENILNGYNVLCFILSFFPCFFLGSSYAFGEAAILAYLRMFPKPLIGAWSSGTGLSSIISGGLNLLSQLINGLSLKFMYLFLAPIGILYLIIFILTSKLLKKDNNLVGDSSLFKNSSKDKEEEDKKDEVINDEDKEGKDEEDNSKEEKLYDTKEEEKKEEETKEEEEKKDEENEENNDNNNQLDNVNANNQVMNWHNFTEVMRMSGRVVINLFFIYFTYFICNNSLTIMNASKLDISFLPLETRDGKLVRKGKYEFINMFFQGGMFTAKTIITLVRKIKPIEVYTFSILTVLIIFFIEYYTGFLPWPVICIFNFVLGFFAGGTYAGAFYVIIHSDQVLPDYKELTVNVATLFNDLGTFVSGLVGYVLMNFVVNSDTPFEGEEIKE